MERVLRLGEVGAGDPIGSPREIDDYIARRLGEPARGPRRVYRALRAMVGHTVLVERRSRQTWVLCLSGVTDSSSILHRAFLAETPALYSLPPSDTGSAATSKILRRAIDDPITPSQPLAPLADPSQELRVELARLHEELAAQRLARVEVDKRREAADAALSEEKRARSEADQRVQVAAAQLTALERELDTLHRALEQERRAREEADLMVQAAAAHRATLEQDLYLLRYALDEERLARAEADKRGQVVEAELVAMQDAHAADAATMRRLIACDQAIGAAAFLIARMHGVNYEDAIKAVHPLIPAAAAVLLAAGDQTPEATGGPPALYSLPASPDDLSPRAATAPALVVPQPPSLPPTPAALGLAVPSMAEPGRTTRTPRARPLTSLAPILDARTEPAVKPSKVGRNDPCLCGSGKKFKRCCGQSA